MQTRDMAYCGLFASLALALPLFFHLLGPLGGMFLPMYVPLVVLAFLVPPRPALLTACVVPWMSSLFTGMPLLWPPFAAILSFELAVQIGVIARWGKPLVSAQGPHTTWRLIQFLGCVLLAGRLLHAFLVGCLVHGPQTLVWVAALTYGLPGVVLILLFVPIFVRARTRRDGVCEVQFLSLLRALHLPERGVLMAAQILTWFERLTQEATLLVRALELHLATRTRAEPVVTNEPILEITNLSFTYPQASTPSLIIPQLSLKSGERLALLGANGTGKTTLFHVIAGFHLPTSGAVKVCSVALEKKMRTEVRRHLGVLFENPDQQFLFPTVWEEVGSALRGQEPADVQACVQAQLKALGLPLSNRPIASLSRGQRQRVALASLLIAPPDLLLLDEPTSALDASEKARLIDVLRACPSTQILATHDVAFAQQVCTVTYTLTQRCHL